MAMPDALIPEPDKYMSTKVLIDWKKIYVSMIRDDLCYSIIDKVSLPGSVNGLRKITPTH
jgi:hypothetical protein